MLYYAIRQKSTGMFLPDIPKGHRAGATHLTPTDKQPPRLFRTGHHAAVSLKHWLSGKMTRRYEEDKSWDKITPVIGREKSDMEIVRVRIELDHEEN